MALGSRLFSRRFRVMREDAHNPADARLDFRSAGSILSALSGGPECAASSSASDPGTDTPRITNYLIESCLGRGGGGSVYRAFRAGSDQPVALKMLTQPFNGAPEAHRAWRELHILQDLRLPNVPRVLDYGTHEGRLYIATELVSGLPLDRYCDGGGCGLISAERAEAGSSPLDLRARVALLARVCEAVHSLHEHGVIHRDLKPSNILIDRHGNPMIIDLGLAFLLDDAMQTLTADGAPLGTPAFMSPEQARGESGEVRRIGTRTDVYSLGAVAFIILTGHTPHDLTGVMLHEALRRVGNDAPRSPRALRPNLPRHLSDVLSKACAPRPQDRYGSALEFGADLRRWLDGRPVEASSPSPWERVVRWAGRHPLIVTAAVCATLAATMLGASGAAVWWLNTRPAHLQLNATAGTVSVLSHAGGVLRTWRGNPNERISARLIESGRASGKAVLVIVGRGGTADPWLTGQLSVGSLFDLERPKWTTGDREPGIAAPPSPWTGVGESYAVGSWVPGDVFPEVPGTELIAVHTQAHHPSAVRVYSLEGEKLYEIWHWGAVVACEWLADPGLIVLAGCDGTRRWDELGHHEAKANWPYAIFAVRPVLGARHGFLNGPTPDPAAHPEWYKYVLPPIASELFHVEAREPWQQDLKGRAVNITLQLTTGDGGIGWIVDAQGRVLPPPASTGPSDSFRRLHPDLDAAAFTLADELPRP